MSLRIIRLGCLLLLVLMLTACNGASKNQNDASVSTTSVKLLNNSDSVMSGKIEAVEMANVVSKTTGKVARVYVDLGSEVKKGQVLVSLECDDLEANVETAQAALDTAQISFDMARQNLDRAEELLAAGALGRADYQNNYEGPYLKSEAALRSAEATLKKSRIAYEDSFVRAPFDGIITARNTNPGEMASVQTALVSIVNLDQVVIKGTVNEKQINNLEIGQEVRVSVAAAAENIVGLISNISPAAESSTKAYPVKVKIENPDRRLKPGMFAEVRIPVPETAVVMIPMEALLKEGIKEFVYVVKDNVVEKRYITTGPEINGQIQVNSGLAEGEVIAATGAQFLQPGQKI